MTSEYSWRSSDTISESQRRDTEGGVHKVEEWRKQLYKLNNQQDNRESEPIQSTVDLTQEKREPRPIQSATDLPTPRPSKSLPGKILDKGDRSTDECEER